MKPLVVRALETAIAQYRINVSNSSCHRRAMYRPIYHHTHAVAAAAVRTLETTVSVTSVQSIHGGRQESMRSITECIVHQVGRCHQ